MKMKNYERGWVWKRKIGCEAAPSPAVITVITSLPFPSVTMIIFYPFLLLALLSVAHSSIYL